jgi:hypothetical protein
MSTSGTAAENILSAVAGGTTVQVAVVGSLARNGALAQAKAYALSTPYVAGVSPVTLTGAVRTVDASTGLARIGNVAVDYSALLETSASGMQIGDVVTVRGTMPQADQPILASVIIRHRR